MRATAIICFMLSGFCIAITLETMPQAFEGLLEEMTPAVRAARIIGTLIGSSIFPLTFFLLGMNSMASQNKKARSSKSN
jgi:hypothetical protein